MQIAMTSIRRTIFIPLMFASLGAAQQPEPLLLSLKEAVNLALKQNPSVIAANLEVARSEEQRSIARSGLLPQIGGNVAETAHRTNLEAAIGFRFPGSAQHVGPYRTFQAGAGFQAQIFDLTLWRRYRSARFGVEASRAGELSAREQNVLLVVSQYLGAQRAAADVQAAQSRVDLAQALYNLAVDLQNSGVGTGIDTLRANVQLQAEKQTLIAARTQLDTALFGLSRLLNVDPLRPIALSDAMATDTPPAPEGLSLEQAYSSRPELSQLTAQERQAELALRTAGEQRLPRLSLNGSWAELGLTPSSSIPSYQYQASLDFPIFTGGRIKAQRADADLALRQLRQQRQDLRNRIALEVKTAAARLESARGQVEVANLGVKLAQEEVTQARDRFQAGVANNIEVITAQNELARASENQIAALYMYSQARADLTHASGRIEALYAK